MDRLGVCLGSVWKGKKKPSEDDKEECKRERVRIKVCDRIGRSKPSVTA